MKKIFFVFLLILFSALSYSQPKLEGRWIGKLDIVDMNLSLDITFTVQNESMLGSIDIKEQNAFGLPLDNIKTAGEKVSFEMPSGKNTAYFKGKIIGDSLPGTFTQSGIKGKFSLKRTSEQKVSADTVNLPYNSEDVTFYNGALTFAGTLTTPKTEGKHPAVVMITGSGPQDRNEDIYGFKIFGIIADHLTRSGIAVLRYDDRGIGGSTGSTVSESTTDDFAGDVVEAVKFLQARNDINAEQVGLFGHSEGGIVAPLAFTKYDKIAFMVLMAGTGVKGFDILKEQSKLIMKADTTTTEEDVAGYLKMLDMIYETSEKNTGWDELKENIKQNIEENYDRIPEETKKYIKDKDEYINSQASATVKQFRSNWMRYFMEYDPSIALSKVTCPVYLLFGANDLQVPPAQNEKPMVDALTKAGNKDFSVYIMPKANHLFQESITGSPNEYINLKYEFIPGFLEAVSGWITQRVTINK